MVVPCFSPLKVCSLF
uniref:Uncharacterized protein n=1 Tax=Anguilla anguilla TaxID=7936 RepID=A0A0E9Q884_ANGAN